MRAKKRDKEVRGEKREDEFGEVKRTGQPSAYVFDHVSTHGSTKKKRSRPSRSYRDRK